MLQGTINNIGDYFIAWTQIAGGALLRLDVPNSSDVVETELYIDVDVFS